MNIFIKPFDALTSEELYELLRLRAEIFVVEQNCVYNDLDGFDKEAIHLFAIHHDEIIAYARMLPPGTRFPAYSIGRLVVKKNMRNTGLGKEIMQRAIHFLKEEWNAPEIKISAQKYLLQFYTNLGFRVVTKEYLEDGIPHLGMSLTIHNK